MAISNVTKGVELSVEFVRDLLGPSNIVEGGTVRLPSSTILNSK